MLSRLTPGSAMIAAMAWLTVSEAAKLAELSEEHVRRLARGGALKAQRVGARLWQVDERSLMRYLATNPKPGPAPRKPR